MIGDNPLVDVKGAQEVGSLILNNSLVKQEKVYQRIGDVLDQDRCLVMFLTQLYPYSTGRVSMVFNFDEDRCFQAKWEPHSVSS